MPKKYDVYDERGRKIGEAEERPSGAEQVIGTFILFWLIWEILKGIGALLVLIVVFLKDHPKFALTLGVLCVIGALYFGIYVPAQEKEAQRVATIVATNALSTRVAQTDKGLSEMRQYRGSIQLGNGQGITTNERGNSVRLDSVSFATDGIRIYFESETTELYGKPQWSCIIWQSQEKVDGASRWSDYSLDPSQFYISEGLYIRPTTYQFSEERQVGKYQGGATVYHYRGYLVYPSAVIPSSAKSMGSQTTYYFKYGCYVTNPYIRLFDVLDFVR